MGTTNGGPTEFSYNFTAEFVIEQLSLFQFTGGDSLLVRLVYSSRTSSKSLAGSLKVPTL